jgi:hypothetical protein
MVNSSLGDEKPIDNCKVTCYFLGISVPLRDSLRPHNE